MDTMKKLEKAFIQAVKELRLELGNDDECPNWMNLTLEAEGRVRDGEMKITYTLWDSSYSSTTKSEGGNLTEVIEEYKRRSNWKNKNAPLCLPNVDDDERERAEMLDKAENEIDERIPF